MRKSLVLPIAAAVAFFAIDSSAFAASRGGGMVRDHRTPPVVRDHRTPPVVRDHRADPVVHSAASSLITVMPCSPCSKSTQCTI
jgi:hypothetical protein